MGNWAVFHLQPAAWLHLRPIKNPTAGGWSFQSRHHRVGNKSYPYTNIWWIMMDIIKLTHQRQEGVLLVGYCAVSIWWPWAVWCLWNNYHCVLIVSPLVSRGQIFRTISSVWGSLLPLQGVIIFQSNYCTLLFPGKNICIQDHHASVFHWVIFDKNIKRNYNTPNSQAKHQISQISYIWPFLAVWLFGLVHWTWSSGVSQETSSQAPSYASPKLRASDLLTDGGEV